MMIVDQIEESRSEQDDVLCWRSYAEGPGVTSVPRYLDEHGAQLRASYIAFIHDFGEMTIAGRRIVDHLDMGEGFSLWWMTKLAEKSPFKSARIFDCLLMMALEQILIERKPSSLTLRSADRPLSEAISRLCRSLRIEFAWIPAARPARSWSIRRIYEALPHTVRGLLSLRHLALRWPVRKLQKPQWFSGRSAIYLCSNFAHLDPAACAEGRFHSYQWEALPRFLHEIGRQANWIHHFLHRPSDVDAKTGLKWIRLFNRDARRQGNHAYLETYLSWTLVAQALKRWLRLNAVAWRLRRIGWMDEVPGTAGWLWPLLRNDWQDSLCGPTGVSNCIWVELFDAALNDIPYQETGLYLWENQAWECALVRAWRRNGHGRIIGVPHSTTPFWYLNLYDDQREFTSLRYGTKPMPDGLAVNGPMARKALLSAGYPANRLIEVEALRFQYLAPFATRRTSDGTSRASRLRRRVLILGDYTFGQTIKMMRCIEAALGLTDLETSVTLKPHPTCSIAARDFSSLQFELTGRPLAEIVGDFDFAFCSNSTSAVLDALLAGLDVAVFLDNEEFNHSPLRGAAGVRFVSSPVELAAALQDGDCGAAPPRVEEFFWIDSRLPRWNRLLSHGTS